MIEVMIMYYDENTRTWGLGSIDSITQSVQFKFQNRYHSIMLLHYYCI